MRSNITWFSTTWPKATHSQLASKDLASLRGLHGEEASARAFSISSLMACMDSTAPINPNGKRNCSTWTCLSNLYTIHFLFQGFLASSCAFNSCSCSSKPKCGPTTSSTGFDISSSPSPRVEELERKVPKWEDMSLEPVGCFKRLN